MDAGEYFSVSWPELAPRLRAMLARAGAPTVERDDLIQETALRLFGMWDRVDHGRPIEPLARRIAMNTWRDQWRRRGDREVTGEVPDLVTGLDTERAALARVELGEVSRALASLPSSTAQVLRSAAAESERGDAHIATTPALRMARTRARRALAACLKVASAAVLATLAGIRSLSRPATSASAVGALAAVAFILAISFPAPKATPPLSGRSPLSPAAVAALTLPSAERSTIGSTRASPNRRAQQPAVSPAPYYVLGVGPAAVHVFADSNVEGRGVRVQQPGPGSRQPICGYGGTPMSVVTPECSRP